MSIRKGQLTDLTELQGLFVDTISEICKVDYDKLQIAVWTSSIENKERWQNILTKQIVLIAQSNDLITGFCTLDKNYIDLLFVHKDYQRQAIASRLYAAIEKEAKQQGHTGLIADVSITAKPL